MRHLEVRRHSFTKKGTLRGLGSDLSAEGVMAARAVGATIGPVAYVAVSRASRTLETALAMGFAVDVVLDLGSGYSSGEVTHHDQWSWPSPYVRYRELIAAGGGLASAAAHELDLWISALVSVPDGGLALIVTHGGSIEPALVAAFPDDDHRRWGGPFSHLDGARLAYDGRNFVALEFRRYQPGAVPPTVPTE